MNLPIIAIVGRPNVGKSALFNRIVGRRMAIVHEQAGVTRDRVMAAAEDDNRHFQVVDTGGLGYYTDEKAAGVFDGLIRAQVEAVAAEAVALILVTDAQVGETPLDREIAQYLRTFGRRVVVAANKADNPTLRESAMTQFAGLGFDSVMPVTCLHGTGIGDLLDAVLKGVPRGAPGAAFATTTRPFRMAVLGRPNVGKSSLVNRLVEQERMIVSDIAGTTRDAVDVPFTLKAGARELPAVVVDTAGLRRKSKVDTVVEFFSVDRAKKALDHCDLALFVVDAADPATAQDRRIASQIVEAGKPCVVVANKWDLAPMAVARNRFRDVLKEAMPFLAHAPVAVVSALKDRSLEPLAESVFRVHDSGGVTVPTAVLNQFLRDLLARTPPSSVGGKPLKLFYGAQVSNVPPRFALFVNHERLCPAAYRIFLANRLREAFYPEAGMPVQVVLRERPQNDPERKERIQAFKRLSPREQAFKKKRRLAEGADRPAAGADDGPPTAASRPARSEQRPGRNERRPLSDRPARGKGRPARNVGRPARGERRPASARPPKGAGRRGTGGGRHRR
ncbi:MAG: ribosome biogenesis GTPase Der [Lentisphaeria bacterium]